ncbi:uncharacterized protein LTHEOB_10628 [Neofusicoccum parvum]|uniref:Uncharacterized protein LTHEOB_10628 n=1 Tax=Neofusicoccum parvum TaxID=310453 RepID=A0ACB5S6F8_9PEZI|nr:uncharacterized protein LTHEOB_10628 [Neofusicoccum parvum]
MSSTTRRLLAAFLLFALVASTAGLEQEDLNHQRGPPKPLPPPLNNRHRRGPNPPPQPPLVDPGDSDSDDDRIQTVDPSTFTPPSPNEETTFESYTADTSFTTPIATGSVHTGGVGGASSSSTTATTTSGVLGPNTTGSAPSGGNVVSGTLSGTEATGTTASSATTGASGAGASASSAGAAAGNVVNVGGLLGVLGVGVGWLL